MKRDVKAFRVECYKVIKITGKRCNDIWVRRRVFKRRTMAEEGKKK